jgi:hypothetical protein
MDSFFQLLDSYFLIQKGKKLAVGHVTTRKDGSKWQKQSTGKWVPVKGGKGEKAKGKKEPKKKSSIEGHIVRVYGTNDPSKVAEHMGVKRESIAEEIAHQKKEKSRIEKFGSSNPLHREIKALEWLKSNWKEKPEAKKESKGDKYDHLDKVADKLLKKGTEIEFIHDDPLTAKLSEKEMDILYEKYAHVWHKSLGGGDDLGAESNDPKSDRDKRRSEMDKKSDAKKPKGNGNGGKGTKKGGKKEEADASGTFNSFSAELKSKLTQILSEDSSDSKKEQGYFRTFSDPGDAMDFKRELRATNPKTVDEKGKFVWGEIAKTLGVKGGGEQQKPKPTNEAGIVPKPTKTKVTKKDWKKATNILDNAPANAMSFDDLPDEMQDQLERAYRHELLQSNVNRYLGDRWTKRSTMKSETFHQLAKLIGE